MHAVMGDSWAHHGALQQQAHTLHASLPGDPGAGIAGAARLPLQQQELEATLETLAQTLPYRLPTAGTLLSSQQPQHLLQHHHQQQQHQQGTQEPELLLQSLTRPTRTMVGIFVFQLQHLG